MEFTNIDTGIVENVVTNCVTIGIVIISCIPAIYILKGMLNIVSNAFNQIKIKGNFTRPKTKV